MQRREASVRGQILGVDVRTGEGQLAGEDGQRYRFHPDDWAHRGEPAIGQTVDFEPDARAARSIFPVPVPQGGLPAIAMPPPEPAGEHSRIAAALLAFFLGTLGVHRFYLGRTGTGLLMLLLSITVIGLFITGPWALVDFIRYLMMSDREFARRYERL